MGPLIALYSLSAAVWTIPLLRSGRVIPFAAIVLAIGTVFGPLYCSIDGPVQISLDRMAMVVLLGFIAVRWRMGQLHIDRVSRFDWIVIGFSIWLLIRALGGAGNGISQWLTFVAMPTGIYAVTRLVEIQDRDIRWFCNLLVALGTYLAVTAVLEVLEIHSLVFPRYIVDPESWEYFGRGRGPLMNPAGNGILMTAALVASILKFFATDRAGKVVYGATTLLMVAGIYATLTRSVWIGAMVAVGLIAMVYLPRWVRILGLATAILLGGAVVSGFKDSLMRLKRDKNLAPVAAEKSVQLRPLLVVVAYEMFKDRPMVGHGYARYLKTSGPYHSIRSYDLPLDQVRHYVQHCVFLCFLVETGLIGLSAFVLWLVMISSIGWMLARGRELGFESRMLGQIAVGLSASYVCNGIFHDVSIIPMVHMMLFFVGGLAVTRFAAARNRSARTGHVHSCSYALDT